MYANYFVIRSKNKEINRIEIAKFQQLNKKSNALKLI